MRTEDFWLYEIEEEMRNWCFFFLENKYTYLHRQPTSFSGSWCKRRNLCGNAFCDILEQNINMQIFQCSKSKEERPLKCKVITGLDETCLRGSNFINAPAIFANNDSNFDVNTKRVRIYAASTGQLIKSTWHSKQGYSFRSSRRWQSKIAMAWKTRSRLWELLRYPTTHC